MTLAQYDKAKDIRNKKFELEITLDAVNAFLQKEHKHIKSNVSIHSSIDGNSNYEIQSEIFIDNSIVNMNTFMNAYRTGLIEEIERLKTAFANL